MTFEEYIIELNGYLKALQRQSLGKCCFGVKEYISNETATEFISNQDFFENKCTVVNCNDKPEVDFRYLAEKIKAFLFADGVLSRVGSENGKIKDYLGKMLVEDINEYYGLAANALNPEGEFHPLIQGPVYLLKLTDKNIEDDLCFLVKVENRYVFTYFIRKITNGVRAN
ncbi:MAG: hypothetical protein GY779_09490 [Gammaproteobacteria bacterium]|nr:hypothetical protein [Gammaproteobacteria bacterium]